MNDIVSLIHSKIPKGWVAMQHPCPILRKFDSSRLDGTMRRKRTQPAECWVQSSASGHRRFAELVLNKADALPWSARNDKVEDAAMTIHHQLTFPLLMAIASLGSVLSMIATRNSGEGSRGQWFVPLWSRKRDSFTATGWRYRTWSVWCGYIFIAVAAADQLIG